MISLPSFLFYASVEREARPLWPLAGRLINLYAEFFGIGVISFLENGKCILLIFAYYAWHA